MSVIFTALANAVPAALGAYLSVIIANRFSRSVASRGSRDWRYLLAVVIAFPVLVLFGFAGQWNLAAKLSQGGLPLVWLNAMVYSFMLVILCRFTKDGRELIVNIKRYAKRDK